MMQPSHSIVSVAMPPASREPVTGTPVPGEARRVKRAGSTAPGGSGLPDATAYGRLIGATGGVNVDAFGLAVYTSIVTVLTVSAGGFDSDCA